MNIRLLFLFSFLLATLSVQNGSAQYYDWGQEPASIKWKRVQGDNGMVVFPDYYEKHALRLMNYMDSVRGQVSYGFRHDPMKMPLVLHTQNFSPNGIVMLAPSRMEFILTPPATTFAMPFHKQLAVHEFRHAVQYSNTNRSFVRVLSYILGQQGSLVGFGQLPFWFLEGDAVLTETQFSSFGRGMQPSMTIDYRGMAAAGKKYRPDKYFSGSFKDHVPDHYTVGYHMVSYTWDKYEGNIWDKIAWFNSRNPYMVFPTKRALRKFYGTSGTKLLHETMERLESHWETLPEQDDSPGIIHTPTTSFTTYTSPVPDGKGSVYAIKRDLDKYNRLVIADTETGDENVLKYVGDVNTGLVKIGGKLWWTEYRQSTFWQQRVNSQLCWYDIHEGKTGSIKNANRVLFPSESREGHSLAYVEYDYTGYYSIVTPPRAFALPDSISVHGLSYDRVTDAYYFIGLSDSGMWLGTIGEQDGHGDVHFVSQPSYATLSDLRADDGKLYYTSIASGRDEAHMLDIASRKDYKLTASALGSFSPAPVPGTGDFAVTTYTPDGYKLALQQAGNSPMEEMPHSTVPVNLFNPAKVEWNVMNIDTVKLGSDDKGREVKRFRKGPRQFRFHSWAPFWFDPDQLLDDNKFNVYAGVTAFSQNILNSTVTTLGYKYTDEGSLFNAGLTFYGLPVNFDIDAEYGTMNQYVSLPSNVIIGSDWKYKNHFRITGRASLPMLLGAGKRTRWLTPMFEMEHSNTLYYEAKAVRPGVETGVQKLRFSLTYTENARMAHKDFLPRFGYAFRVSNTFTPFNDYYGGILSAYGRVYLPGILPHNSLTIRGAVQKQSTALYNFRQKDVYPRGAHFNIAPDRYGAFSADYQFPFWYPDGGINSVVYFKRIRANVFYDYARFRHVGGMWDAGRKKVVIDTKSWDRLYSYGLELTFDIVPFRLPASTDTSFTISIYKPSDHSKPVFSAGLVLPI